MRDDCGNTDQEKQEQQRGEELRRRPLQVRHEVDHDVEDQHLDEDKGYIDHHLHDREGRRPVELEGLVLEPDPVERQSQRRDIPNVSLRERGRTALTASTQTPPSAPRAPTDLVDNLPGRFSSPGEGSHLDRPERTHTHDKRTKCLDPIPVTRGSSKQVESSGNKNKEEKRTQVAIHPQISLPFHSSSR